MSRLIDILSESLKDTVPMHMPGHKRNIDNYDYLKKLSADVDITEIDGFDNLHNPKGILLESMNRAAKLYGAKNSYFLVNGSTCGILSSIYAVVGRGDKVLCARNCHSSVYNALEIVGAMPFYVLPEKNDRLGLSYVRPDNVNAAFEKNPDIKLCIITSPTYEGIESDIEKIAKTVHSHNALLFVDASHGAHFGFDCNFPENAVKKGADLVVHSLHKTMPSLTQTALLHICSDRVEKKKVERALSIFETSSPSYLLMASIDGCIDLVKKEGKQLFDNWNKILDDFYSETKRLEKLEIYLSEENILKDKSKIIVLCDKTDINGYELSHMLRKRNIEVEMSSLDYVIAMTGLIEKEDNLKKLASALFEIDKELKKCEKKERSTFSIPKHALTPSDAVFCKKEYVPFKKALDRISCCYIKAYPPGIPVIVPGERFDKELFEYIDGQIKQGTEFLCSDGDLLTKISVIAD